jgi:hypothetical protein
MMTTMFSRDGETFRARVTMMDERQRSIFLQQQDTTEYYADGSELRKAAWLKWGDIAVDFGLAAALPR